MHTVNPYLEAYQQALDALTSDQSIDPYDQDDLDRAAAALMRVIKRRGNTPAPAAQAMPPAQTVGQRPKARPYANLSVVEATVAYLSTLPEKETKSAGEIVEQLTESGYEFEAGKPESALATALRRREGNFGDVINVGRGRWGLRAWYTQREATGFRHTERTKAGMDAASARGVKFGKAWKLNAEQATEFKRLMDEGAKNSRLAKVFGLSGMGAATYRKRLKDWSPGDPYPPAKEPETPQGEDEATDEGGRSSIRVVK